jgi:ABC-2 type transport system ATP-binding protein
MSETAITIQNLIRDFETVRALDGLSLEVPAGIVYGFLGPNGAGKTTTINILLGLMEPNSGRAEVLGFDTATQGDQIRAQVGALLEYTGLYTQMSAADNLEFYGRAWHMPAAERKARTKELLIRLGYWERRDEKVGNWSRGMRQKLGIARALYHRPQLLFLDEPTAGLDVMAANDVREQLADLAADEGVTIFLTTHNMAEAERLCRQVAVIRAGKVVAVGHPDELRRQSGGPRVEVYGRGFTEEVVALARTRPEVVSVQTRNGRLILDLQADAEVSPLVNMLVGAGVDVEEVRRGKASLEDVFLTLMEEEK